MKREYYSDSIGNFRNTKPDEILGRLARNNDFSLEQPQRDAWLSRGLPYETSGVVYFTDTFFRPCHFTVKMGKMRKNLRAL